jgi:hypothetical protein
MTSRTAQHIVDQVLALRDARPELQALAVFDAVMEGHRGTSPDFDTGTVDHTDAGMPFGDLLREAFGRADDVPDDEQAVLDRFAARYRLWQG